MAFRRRRGGNPDKGDDKLVKMARRFNCSVAITTALGFGFPDWVMGVRGITVMVERKNKGGDLRKKQIEFVREWNGGPLIMVQDGIDLQALITSRDILAHCAARDLRVMLGFRQAVTYALARPVTVEPHTTMGPPTCSE